MYYIKEIFKSIQGEGFYSGKEAVFIRFAGCNFWNGILKDKNSAICNFCDTNFNGTDGKNGGIYDVQNLVKKTLYVWNKQFSLQKKFVILTGGEPLLQVNSLLIKNLKKEGFYIAVETNGSINCELDIDWICVSPKSLKEWTLKKGNELKVIFPQYKFNLNELKKLKFDYFFLQPMDGINKQLNTWNTINYCKAHKPWFPSFQLHKTLNIS
tara:strand:- start:276 stop:908 length:633 start_codon:yes stop_codon:yes gene_type:complete